jgi:hypothetical protein
VLLMVMCVVVVMALMIVIVRHIQSFSSAWLRR